MSSPRDSVTTSGGRAGFGLEPRTVEAGRDLLDLESGRPFRPCLLGLFTIPGEIPVAAWPVSTLPGGGAAVC